MLHAPALLLAVPGQLDTSRMPLLGAAFRALALGLWFGGGLTIVLATRAIFAAAESRKQAGAISGAVLRRFRALQILALLLLVPAYLFGARGTPLGLGLFAALLFLVSIPVDAALRTLRDALGGSTEGLGKGDPRRARFGALHGVSVLLLLGQIACASVGLVAAALAGAPQ